MAKMSYDDYIQLWLDLEIAERNLRREERELKEMQDPKVLPLLSTELRQQSLVNIRQRIVECKQAIVELKNQIQIADLDPYQVLKLPPHASGKAIYKKHLLDLESLTSYKDTYWRDEVKRLEAKPNRTEDEEWEYYHADWQIRITNNKMMRIREAYAALAPTKPYDPNNLWHRLFG